MVEDLSLSVRAVGPKRTSIKSHLNPFLQPPENNLSPHAQPKWLLTSLPIPQMEPMLRPRERSNESQNNAFRLLFFILPRTLRASRQ